MRYDTSGVTRPVSSVRDDKGAVTCLVYPARDDKGNYCFLFAISRDKTRKATSKSNDELRDSF